MSRKKENRRNKQASPDSKLNIVTAVINLIIALLNAIAIMKNF